MACEPNIPPWELNKLNWSRIGAFAGLLRNPTFSNLRENMKNIQETSNRFLGNLS